MRRNVIPLLFISVVLLGCFFVAALTPWAQSPTRSNVTVVRPLVLYDDFNGYRIDPAKWDDWMASGGMREAVREVSPSYQGEGNNGRLHIFQRSYSTTASDDGASYGWLGLRWFTNPSSVTEVVFQLAVNKAAISGCQSNPTVGGASSGFVGRFFNYSGQLDQSQDVEAGIALVRDSTDSRAPLSVQAHYNSIDGTAGDNRVLGFVSLGQTARLRIKWDQPNHQFLFQLNSDPVVSLGYGLSDTAPTVDTLKAFWVVQGTPNCTTTPPGSAMMDVYFDNVYVNAH